MLITRLLVAACSILFHRLLYWMGAFGPGELGFQITVSLELLRVALAGLIVPATLFIVLRAFAWSAGIQRSRVQTVKAVLYISAYELLTIAVMPLCWVAFVYIMAASLRLPYTFIGVAFYVLLALRYGFPLASGHLGCSGARRVVVPVLLVCSLFLLPAVSAGLELAAHEGWPAERVAEALTDAFADLVTQVPHAGWNL